MFIFGITPAIHQHYSRCWYLVSHPEPVCCGYGFTPSLSTALEKMFVVQQNYDDEFSWIMNMVKTLLPEVRVCSASVSAFP